MSYINRAQIYCPIEVRVEVKNAKEYSVIWVSGEYGTWFLKINDALYRVNVVSPTRLCVSTIRFYSVLKHYYTKFYKYSTPQVNTRLSLICVLIKRMIIGAGVGFKKYLRVRGVGYKFELKKSLLTAKVGYTHLVTKQLPYEFYTRFSRKSKVVRFRSKSLTKISSILAYIRSARVPDVYKGKGIRYRRDPIRRKPGKRKTKAVSKKKKIFNARKKIPLKRRRKKRRREKISLKLFLSQRPSRNFNTILK